MIPWEQVPEGLNGDHSENVVKENALRHEWHLLNSYRRAIDLPTRVISSGKRREYVPVGSRAPSLAPTFPPETTRIGLSKCHSPPAPLLSNVEKHQHQIYVI